MEINENTKIEFLFRKNDGEEMSFILTLAQLEGSEPNFYKQAKKMMKEDGENWEDWEIVGRRIVEE
jgi:hypothetical protein